MSASSSTGRGNWIAVASAEHVRAGIDAGIMQVCHGKAAPLRRIQPGDCVAYYSPTATFRGKDKCQAFTALGIVRGGLPYQVDMGEGFRPYRRDVEWFETCDAPIAPLLDRLEFSAGKSNWGYQLRFGLFWVSEGDMRIIAQAMKAKKLAVEFRRVLVAAE
jgi:hypothetical protein